MNAEYEKKRAEIESSIVALVGDGATVQFGRIPDEKAGGELSPWSVVWGPAMTLGDVRCLRAVPILDRNGEVSGWRIRLLVSLHWWDTPNGVNAHRRFELERWVVGLPGMDSVFFGRSAGDAAVMIQGFHRDSADSEQSKTIDEFGRWLAHRRKNATEFAELDSRVLEFEAELMAEDDQHAKP